MDFLKAILGDSLFVQVQDAVNAYNADEKNKDNLIKIANLGGGDYVSKGKHTSEIEKLNNVISGKNSELKTANELIEQLKKENKDNESLQNRIGDYETQVSDLQNQIAETKLKSAVKVALLEANAADVDYLTFKLQEKLKDKGEKLELGDDDKLKGWDAQLDGLKTQFPNMFGAGEGGEFKPYEGGGLPKGNEDKTVTKEQFKAMNYEQRVALKKDNEKLYEQLRG